MPECAKTHLQQSRISKFSGENPRTPSSRGRGGKGGEGRRGRGKGRREGKDREGTGGTGRDRGGKEGGRGGMGWWWGGEGREEEGRSTWAPPPETSSGSAPGTTNRLHMFHGYSLHHCHFYLTAARSRLILHHLVEAHSGCPQILTVLTNVEVRRRISCQLSN